MMQHPRQEYDEGTWQYLAGRNPVKLFEPSEDSQGCAKVPHSIRRRPGSLSPAKTTNDETFQIYFA